MKPHIEDRLKELAEWLEDYRKWYKKLQEQAQTQDDSGSNPNLPPPPPPPPPQP